MACKTIYQDGKPVGIACGRTPRQYCETCGVPSQALCDYPVVRNGKEATCDRKCCRRHSKHVGPEKDYCLPHQRFVESVRQ